MNTPDDDQARKTDWSGTIIGVSLWPVLGVFILLGRAELGFTVGIVLGMTAMAVRLRWELRKRVWFWPTVGFILLLHVPLLFIVRWPQNNVPTIAYSLPIGVVDFLLIMGAIDLANNVFSIHASSGDEEA